jgi:hypothetical protein
VAGDGAVAAYTGTNETGNGVVIFVGDSQRAGDEWGVTGMTAVNFQNCTNQHWEIGEPGQVAVDNRAPGTDGNITPVDFVFQDTAASARLAPAGFTPSANVDVAGWF